MHPFALIAFALLLAAGPSLAAPSLPPEVESTREEEEPHGDRFEDRWQGRRHWLYDEQDAATDGRGANAQAHCVNALVRVKRPDGSTTRRWTKRCD
jgi:hypothetical protein